MDLDAVLTAFDEQVRRNPEPIAGERVEREDLVVRLISEGDGWTGVTWCNLDEANAGPVIASQIVRFASLGRPWEWKHYSWDRPVDLPDRLRAAGFRAEAPEAMLVGDTSDLPQSVLPPSGVDIVVVANARDVSSFVAVNDEVFGNDNSWIGGMLLADLARGGTATAALLAIVDGTPVGALRLEFPGVGDFAALYSVCTVSAWRRRGVFRSLLAEGVSIVVARGFHYLQADAVPDSRPILKRLGCVELGTTTPFVHPGRASSSP